MSRFKLCTLSVFVLCCISASAQAQSLYAGAVGGYAMTTSDRPYDVEPYGVGGGASAGLALPVIPIYLGARVLWFIGDTASTAGVTLESHYMMYGVDLGYDAELGPIVFRPAIGIGRAVLQNSGSAVGATLSKSDGSLYFAPGVGLVIKAGLLYVGAELRYNALTEDEHYDSVSILGSLGVTI